MKYLTLAALGGALFLAFLAPAPPARAFEMRNVGECAPGTRVKTVDGHTGVITRIDRAWSYCYVRRDDTGQEEGYLYSLLERAGPGGGGGGAFGTGGGVTAADLPPGVYECFADGQYTFMDMRITGPNSYVSANWAGRFHLDGSGKIVFQSGPLQRYRSRLLSAHRIGLSTGDSFYATSCELNRRKR